jgi:hypothetical protein
VLADAYVRAGQYANTNYGGAAELIVKFGADAVYLREAYLLLDISTVQPGQAVRLRLFGKLSDTRAASVSTAVVPLAPGGWTETSLTWNNRPSTAAVSWGTVTVSGTAANWYELDVTTQVQALRASGQASVALVLKGTADTLPYVAFSARETPNAPQLVTTP